MSGKQYVIRVLEDKRYFCFTGCRFFNRHTKECDKNYSVSLESEVVENEVWYWCASVEYPKSNPRIHTMNFANSDFLLDQAMKQTNQDFIDLFTKELEDKQKEQEKKIKEQTDVFFLFAVFYGNNSSSQTKEEIRMKSYDRYDRYDFRIWLVMLFLSITFTWSLLVFLSIVGNYSFPVQIVLFVFYVIIIFKFSYFVSVKAWFRWGNI